MGKARVAPLKQVTIPRMELTAALVSVRMSKYLCKELKYPSVGNFFSVDSKIVLGYINNEARRFHIYLANRIQQIRDLTLSEEWHYVESKCNPSDEASRGFGAKTFVSARAKWLAGPEFLLQKSDLAPKIPFS